MEKNKIVALLVAVVILLTGLGFYLISKNNRHADIADFSENFSVAPLSADIAGMEL